MAIFGLACGSLFSGPIINKSRRQAMMIGNLIVLVSVVFQVIEINIILISIGKLIQGFGSGMAVAAVSITIAETIPASHLGIFGALINLGIVIGISIYMFLN